MWIVFLVHFGILYSLLVLLRDILLLLCVSLDPVDFEVDLRSPRFARTRSRRQG